MSESMCISWQIFPSVCLCMFAFVQMSRSQCAILKYMCFVCLYRRKWVYTKTPEKVRKYFCEIEKGDERDGEKNKTNKKWVSDKKFVNCLGFVFHFTLLHTATLQENWWEMHDKTHNIVFVFPMYKIIQKIGTYKFNVHNVI
jgi:hypothetical protein